LLVTHSLGGPVVLWDLGTGVQLCRLGGHREGAVAANFSPDGALLATAGADTTVLLWDVRAIAGADRRAAPPPGPEELERLWDDLAGADAGRAHRAMIALGSNPGTAVTYLGGRLRPVRAPDDRRLARLLADLGHDDFGVRETATRELLAVVDVAAPRLREVLAGRPSAEVRLRVQGVLASLSRGDWAPELLRVLRCIEALEHMGTPEARRLLRELAAGAAEARLTQEAKAALERLGRRP
jgi:hypothetical protein